jgi:hypothetical protein
MASAALGLAALLSVADLRREYQALVMSRQGISMQLPALARLAGAPPASLRGRRSLMDVCDSGLRGPYGAMQPKDLRDRMAERCAGLAMAILRRSPTDAIAHLVRAEAALYDGDMAGFAQALTLAQRNAPSEGWIAQRRIDLVAMVAGPVPDPLRAGLDADLALLFGTPEYLRALALIYQQRETMRPFLTAAAELQPPEVQARFLALLRSAAR